MKPQLFTQRQMTRRVLTGALLSLSVLATSGPAAALVLDGKSLPGSACEPTFQSQPYVEDSLGRIFNPSATQTLFVNCPIVRDVLLGNSSNGIVLANVHVIDRNPSQASNANIVCTLFSVDSRGSPVESISRTTTTGTEGVRTTLTFADLASTVGGSYNLACSIPPQSGNARSEIIMYQVQENEQN